MQTIDANPKNVHKRRAFYAIIQKSLSYYTIQHSVCTHTAKIDRQTMAANIKIHIYVYCFGMAIGTGGRGGGNSDDGGDGGNGGDGDNNRHTHSHMVRYVRRFYGRTNSNFRCPSLILLCRFWSFANPVCAWQVYWAMIKCVRMCEMGMCVSIMAQNIRDPNK